MLNLKYTFISAIRESLNVPTCPGMASTEISWLAPFASGSVVVSKKNTGKLL